MDTRGLLGCRLVSEVSLPELPPCPASPAGPDIVVDLASGAIDDFKPAARISPLLEIDKDRACRLCIPGIATFDVRDGTQVRIAPDSAAPSADVRRFLLGPVVTLLCHQRGLLPLQGACVSRGGDATLICGLPGSGKSTLAAALVKKGFDVVCDDLIPVGGAVPVVLPTVSRLNLWRNSLDALGIPCDGLAPSRPGQEYYHYGVPESGMAEALAVARIVVIERAETSSERLEMLPPRLAVRRLGRAIDEPHLVAALGLQQRLMDSLSKLAEHIPVYGLKCRLSFNELNQLAACFA